MHIAFLFFIPGTMLSVSNLSIHFGGYYLFDNISFLITRADRIGLVGKNGAGKSTLLKILAGVQQPEEGVIARPNGYTIGYLPQDGITASGKTVYNEAATAFSELLDLEASIRTLTAEIAERTDYDSAEYTALLDKLAEANDHFARFGGLTMQADIERTLTGLGFAGGDMQRLTDEFSGGWQMRIELAKILLRRPDCILLDEPTNHLDIESIQWLEEFLKNYEGSVVLVSHDRVFLDAVTNRTIEISNGKTYDYSTSYSAYVQQRAERREMQMAAFKNQQKQIEQTERFIERFRYKASKAIQVQSRIKHLDKLERVDIDDEDTASIHFRFPEAPRSGRVVTEVQHLTKSYGDNTVLRDVSLVLERGERVAFVGKNGEGKSTLARIIVGRESYDGTCETGHNVKIGYYAQHQAELLNGDMTVFEVIDSAASGDMRLQVRSLLGAFLFSGDSVNKKVKVLSGGEKSRLALAKLLLEPVNLLVLDEPTNHLDMRSKDVLKQALLDYEGALIIVSHDRDFLQGLTQKVVEFRGGGLNETTGDIYDFLRLKKMEHLQELEAARPATSSAEDSQADRKSSAQLDREERKKRQAEERRIQRKVEECEKDIATLEEQAAGLEATMSAPDFYADPEHSRDTVARYEQCQKHLEEKMEMWAVLQEQLEEVKES